MAKEKKTKNRSLCICSYHPILIIVLIYYVIFKTQSKEIASMRIIKTPLNVNIIIITKTLHDI